MNTAAMLMTISTVGFASASVRLISNYVLYGKKKIGGTMKYIIKNSVLLNILISALLLSFILIFGSFGEFDLYIVFGIILYLFFYSFYTLSNNFLIGLQKMKCVFTTNMILFLTRIFFVAVLIIYLGFGYFAPVFAFVITVFIVLILRFPHFYMTGKIFNKKEIMSYSIPSIFIAIGWAMIYQGNIVVLGILTNMEIVGIFTIGFLFSTLVRIVPQTISTSIIPTISQQWELKESKRLRMLIEQSIRYSISSIVPIGLFFIVFAVELIQLFSTTEYISSALSAQILIIGSVFIGITTIFNSILYSIGSVKENRNIVLIGGILNILFCLALIPIYGIEGAAAASVICGIFMLLSMIYYTKKKVVFSINFKMILKIVISVLGFVLTIYTVKLLVYSYLLRLIISVISGSIVYLFLLYILKFFESTDITMLKNLERNPPKFIPKIMVSILRPILRFVSDMIKKRSA